MTKRDIASRYPASLGRAPGPPPPARPYYGGRAVEPPRRTSVERADAEYDCECAERDAADTPPPGWPGE